MRHTLARRVTVVVTAALLAVIGAACEPIENAPPGGGEVIEGTYRLGPFNLAPNGQAGDDDQGTDFGIPRPAGAFGMKAIDFDLVYADGTSVPHSAAHLHHIVLMNRARQSQNCSNWPERFAGSGSERVPTELPDPYAYLVGASDQWGATWHVMNESDQPQQVYLQYRMDYQPGATAQNSRSVTPFFLDVTGCSNSEYDVPGNGGPGSVHTNSRTWNAPWTGYLVTAEGHVHGGGIDVAIRHDEADAECKMVAEYEHSHPHGAPGYITTCPTHVRFEAGDPYTVTARYENDEPIDGAMGIVMAYAWRGTQ